MQYLLSIQAFSFCCSVRSIALMRPVSAALWAIPTLLLTYTNFYYIGKLLNVINKIELDKYGSHVYIEFSYGVTEKVYIPHLSLLEPEQLNHFYENNQWAVARHLYPVYWSKKERMLLLPSIGHKIEDEDLLTNILSGKLVDISQFSL